MLLAALLSGCGGASAHRKTGNRLIKEYLSGRGRGAVVTESHADVLRPDADKLVLSDYVKGTFRADGESYDFAVNVVTGEIYTSELLPAFEESCIRVLEEQLHLNPGDCVGCCSVMTLKPPAWQEDRPEWPGQRTSLGHVLPVTVQDMDAYAARTLSDGDIRLVVYVACRNTELLPERWTEAVADWDDTEVTLLALPDPDAPLPAPEALTVDYRNTFPGDKLKLSDAGIVFETLDILGGK